MSWLYLSVILNKNVCLPRHIRGCVNPTESPVGCHDERLDVFLRCKPALIESAASIVGRPRAEDVVQDAWLRFTGPLPDLRQPAGYLFRVVRNLAIDLLRRSSWEVQGEAAETVLMSTVERAATPEQQAIASDDLRSVMQVLDGLPPLTRRAFELHRFEEHSYSEIARRLGVSQGKAHALVQDAVARCVERLMGAEVA